MAGDPRDPQLLTPLLASASHYDSQEGKGFKKPKEEFGPFFCGKPVFLLSLRHVFSGQIMSNELGEN